MGTDRPTDGRTKRGVVSRSTRLKNHACCLFYEIALSLIYRSICFSFTFACVKDIILIYALHSDVYPVILPTLLIGTSSPLKLRTARHHLSC